MEDISPERALLVALLLETFFYGFYATLFLVVFVVLHQRPSWRKVSTVTMHLLLFTLVGMHYTTAAVRVCQAFLDPQSIPARTGIPLSHPVNVLKSVIYVTQTVLADSFTIYRLYRIWNRRYVVTFFSFFLLAGTAAAGYGVSCRFALSKSGIDIFHLSLKPWLISFFGATLINSLYCSCLIVYSIRRSQCTLTGKSRKDLQRAMVVVVGSCALYAALLFALIIAYASGSNGHVLVLDLLPPLMGINFCVIVLFSAGDPMSVQAPPGTPVELRTMRHHVRESVVTRPHRLTVSSSHSQFESEKDTEQAHRSLEGLRRGLRWAGPEVRPLAEDMSYLSIV